MKFNKINKYINDSVLALFGILDILLILRFFLKLIGARIESSFVQMIYNSTESFVEIFDKTIGVLDVSPFSFEIDTLIAIFVYFLIGLGLFKFLEAIFERQAQNKLRLGLDTFFKVLEASLGMRLFFKLVGAGDSQFINLLYKISDIFYKPFEGLLPNAGADKYIFETSTLVAVIIIVILDIATENLFQEIKKKAPEKKEDLPDNFVHTRKDTFEGEVKPVINKVLVEEKPMETIPVQTVINKEGQISKIINEQSGQSAIIEVDRILSPLFYKNPNLLTRAEKNIVLIEEFEREINNGGFHQFFINSSGSYAHETLAALSSIKSIYFTKLLKKAIEQFPNEVVPKIHETRQQIIESISEQSKPIWTKLDTEFYKYEEDIYGLMIEYIKENIGDFR